MCAHPSGETWDQEFNRDHEAVQQPVGVGGIAARLELPQPRRTASRRVSTVFFEQMLEVRVEARAAMRASTRRSASASASAQIRSVVVAGRMVRV